MTNQSTVLFESDIHNALLQKSESTNRSLSELVNEAVRNMLLEDEEDIAAFSERESEPTISFDELMSDLKDHG